MDFKKYIPIILVLIFIGLLVTGYFLTWPKYQEFGAKNKELSSKDEELKEREKYLSELNALSLELENYSEELSRVNSALPTEASVAALFYFVKDINLKNILDFQTIDISQLYGSSRTKASNKPTSTSSGVIRMPFSILVSGSYPRFKDFLIDLYFSSRIISVKSLEFSSGGESKLLFDFDLDLETQKYNSAAVVQEFQQETGGM